MWLKYNEFTNADIKRLLYFASQHYQRSVTNNSETEIISISRGLSLCESAFVRIFPSNRKIVSRVLSGIETDLAPNPEKYPRPYTIDRGAEQAPLISGHFRGSAADLLNLMHELSHAMQIVLSAGSKMPPVGRELCAFLGERALLAYAESDAPDLFPALSRAWEHDTSIYLGENLAQLLDALDCPDSTYDYRWNYPVARLLAGQVFRSWEADRIWKLFSSGADAPHMLDLKQFEPEIVMDNHLPALPPPETPIVDVYRQLGAAVLLDIQYWSGAPEASLEAYYAEMLSHMKGRSLFLGINETRQPIGYATWQADPSGQASVVIEHLSAPFGDHLKMQRTMRAHLPEMGAARSHNPRSARPEQVAW